MARKDDDILGAAPSTGGATTAATSGTAGTTMTGTTSAAGAPGGLSAAGTEWESTSREGGRTEQAGGESTADILRRNRNRAVEDAKGMIRNMADDQKMRAADGLKGFASALHRAADSMEQERQPLPARYMGMAADQLDHLCGTLRERDWDQLMGDVQSLAKRQPALFIAGAMATGFLLARFLKAEPEQPRYERQQGYGATGATGYTMPESTQQTVSGGEFI